MTSTRCRLLLIDNYDSFVFNAKHLFELAGAAFFGRQEAIEVVVMRNDESFLPLLAAGNFDGVIIGPGPGTPEDDEYFGHSKQVILEYGQKGLPVLGICLGFQGIYHVFGGALKKAQTPIHGKVSLLSLQGESGKQGGALFSQVAQGAGVMRYHSIMADLESPVPDCFELTAFVEEKTTDIEAEHRDTYTYAQAANGRELMALEHKLYPIYGVQFHPESFATECGFEIAHNFIQLCANNSDVPKY